MNISKEEKLMYSVMKAIYDSKIPMSFKGSMVLKAFLLEVGFKEETRHTLDIDANWYSDTAPSAEQMVKSIQKALQNYNINLNVSIYRMYGKGRSAGFELSDINTKDVLFTMDIDVNRPASKTKIYEINGICFCGVVPSQMIADKISTISTDKVFRRIKDVIDLYYISKVFAFNKAEILETLKNSSRNIDSFDGFLHKSDNLRHSYEKFRFSGNIDKPPFDEVYNSVKLYIKDILPKEKNDKFKK